MKINSGFTLVEILIAIALVIVIIGIIAGGVNAKIRLAEAEECKTTLAGMTPMSQLCMIDIQTPGTTCAFCTSYNAMLTSYNASAKCKDFGPITLVSCPPPQPSSPSPPSDE